MTVRQYIPSETIPFSKTKEEFGGLSNMAAGFQLCINDVIIPTAEHLYQACKFPNFPEIQFDILNEHSPMKAKWISRSKNHLVRYDWEKVMFKVMEWVLEVKLSQNWESFGELLSKTANKNIVEYTKKDKVWGAQFDGHHYVGTNALGRLLMLIREKYVITNDRKFCVEPLTIANFNFLGSPIGLVCDEDYVIQNEMDLGRRVLGECDDCY